jgi:hypothetical protein
MSKMPKAEISPAELDSLIVKAATPTALPASRLLKALPQPYRPPEKQWRKTLERLVSEGRLCRWPVRKGLYATTPYEEFAKERVRAALAHGPLGKAALEKSSGVNRTALDRLLPSMKAAGELHVHHGRRYGSRPAEDLDYVLGSELDKLARSHVARGLAAEAVRAAIARWAGPGAPATSGEAAVLDAMRQLNPRVEQGDLVYLPHLRTALKDRFPDKVPFDRVVLSLAEQRRVQLQSHPVPSQIKPAERESMIEDGSGSFYMVIGLRR